MEYRNKLMKLALLVFVLFISACSIEDDPDDVPKLQVISSLNSTDITIGPECDDSETDQTVSFAHLADLHGRFAMQDRKFEKLKHFYQTKKQQNPYTVFTNAGDDYEKGSVVEALSNGQAVTEAIFAMEFDVRTIGNHDFAWGAGELVRYAQDPHAKVLATNTEYVGENAEAFTAFDFVTAQVGCVKVGFFGMVSFPWNELDETYDGHFLPEVINDFSYRDISQSVITSFRNQVDILVLISHLGVVEDEILADGINGIDLIVGGHSHRGVSENMVNDTLVIQPDFYANGISIIDIEFNLTEGLIISFDHNSYATEDMITFDTQLATSLDTIADTYGSSRHQPIAYAEFDADDVSVADINLTATFTEKDVDVVLFNPDLVWTAWDEGELSQQTFYSAYAVERQKSNTPGFNSVYNTSIAGSTLKEMLVEQPNWLFMGPDSLDDDHIYNVALNKGPAINKEAFFSESIQYATNADFVSETWEILASYANTRMSECLYIDTDNEVAGCTKSERVLFDFNSEIPNLKAVKEIDEITYLNGLSAKAAIFSQYIVTPSSQNINSTNATTGHILKLDALDNTKGLVLLHQLFSNGKFVDSGKQSQSTIIFDLYIPKNEHSPLEILQTNTDKMDNTELFINQNINNRIESIGFFTGIKFDLWQRVAIVVNPPEAMGETAIYIDGKFVGVYDDDQWTIIDKLLLFTNNSTKFNKGYIDNILLVNKSLTELEVQLLGDAKQVMSTSRLPLSVIE